MKQLVCGSLLAIVAASGAFASGASESAPAQTGPVEMTVTTYVDHYKEGFRAVIDAINANPELNVQLSVDAISGGDQGSEIIKLRYASNEIADFIETNGVGEIITSYGVRDGVLPIEGDWTANFDPGLLASSTYTYDGTVRGVPFGAVNVGGMLYNKRVFEEQGISIPNTHEELLAVCETISRTDVVPVFVSGKDTWTLQIYGIVGFSRHWLGRDASAAEITAGVFRNEESWEEMDLFWDTLARYKEIIDLGYVNETWLADTYDMAQEALATGTAAMYPMASWVFGDLQTKFPELVDDIGAFAIPFEGGNHAPAWAPFAFMMTSNCSDREVGQEVIEFVGSKAGQQAFFDAQPGIPASQGLDVDLLPGQQDLYEVFGTPGRGGLVYQALGPASGIPSYQIDYAAICERVLTDTTTIQEEAARLAQDYVEAGKTQGIPGF